MRIYIVYKDLGGYLPFADREIKKIFDKDRLFENLDER